MTLDESIQDDKDVVEDSGDLKFVYENEITSFVDGKSIDYLEGPSGGFSITDDGAAGHCGDCC